jgi:hypothetical protein
MSPLTAPSSTRGGLAAFEKGVLGAFTYAGLAVVSRNFTSLLRIAAGKVQLRHWFAPISWSHRHIVDVRKMV